MEKHKIFSLLVFLLFFPLKSYLKRPRCYLFSKEVASIKNIYYSLCESYKNKKRDRDEGVDVFSDRLFHDIILIINFVHTGRKCISLEKRYTGLIWTLQLRPAPLAAAFKGR